MIETLQPLPRDLPADEALAVLRELMHDENATASARVAAARILLGWPEPKNDEERKREAEEREMSLAAARGLLADLAAAKLASVGQPPALDQVGAPQPADAADGQA
jgi:hypothetical protein